MKKTMTTPFSKLVLVGIIIFAAISSFSAHKEINQAEALCNELEWKIDELVLKNSQLEFAIAHKNDDDIIEEIARTALGLIKNGEKVFYDLSN